MWYLLKSWFKNFIWVFVVFRIIRWRYFVIVNSNWSIIFFEVFDFLIVVCKCKIFFICCFELVFVEFLWSFWSFFLVVIFWILSELIFFKISILVNFDIRFFNINKFNILFLFNFFKMYCNRLLSLMLWYCLSNVLEKEYKVENYSEKFWLFFLSLDFVLVKCLRIEKVKVLKVSVV